VTDATAKVGNYPFTTIKPNNGIGKYYFVLGDITAVDMTTNVRIASNSILPDRMSVQAIWQVEPVRPTIW